MGYGDGPESLLYSKTPGVAPQNDASLPVVHRASRWRAKRQSRRMNGRLIGPWRRRRWQLLLRSIRVGTGGLAQAAFLARNNTSVREEGVGELGVADGGAGRRRPQPSLSVLGWSLGRPASTPQCQRALLASWPRWKVVQFCIMQYAPRREEEGRTTTRGRSESGWLQTVGLGVERGGIGAVFRGFAAIGWPFLSRPGPIVVSPLLAGPIGSPGRPSAVRGSAPGSLSARLFISMQVS